MNARFRIPGFLSKVVLAAAVAAALSSAQRLPDKLSQTLQKDLQFKKEDVATAEAGRTITKIVETGDPEDIFVVGVIRIATTPANFVSRYKNITEFEASPSVPAGAKFSTPPKESDVAGFSLTKSDVDGLRDCQPGDCDFKIGDRGMQRLRSSVNWKDPNYVQLANRSMRTLWLEYLAAYQASGNSSLAAYHDTPKVFRVEQGLIDQLKKSPYLYQSVPELVDHLQKYPASKLANSEDFFYWQQADFGLKPVHRMTHVVIQRKPAQYGEGAVIASKMMFASHYFRSALEFRFLVPAQSPAGNPQLYLVVLQRSYVDGLGGFKGKLLRGPILSKTEDALERYLLGVKGKLESK
jgi:hypothetical protein